MTDRSALQQLIKYPTLSYGTKLGTVVEELPLAPGRTYVLSMRDIYGDGSCCSNGVGYARVYSVTNGVQSEILYRDGTFEYKLNWMFKVPEAAA